MTSGTVAESLTSADDVILKIADDSGDLSIITVKDAAGKILTIYDKDYINQCKEVFLEFSNAYIKSAIKAFEEDEDVQSILIDGENSAVLAEIKTVDSELAAQIATAIKLSYEAANEYLDTFVESNSSANSYVLFESSNASADNGNIGAIGAFSSIMSSLEVEAITLSNMNQSSALATGLGKGMSKATGPLSVGVSITACAAYSAMLYNENLVPAFQNQGHYGGTLFQKIAKIRSYNSEVFDGWIGSGIDLFCNIGSATAISIMGIAGIAGAPVIITASTFFAASLALNWAYKRFIAPKFDAEADKLQKMLKDNFADEVGDIAETVENWTQATERVSTNGNGEYTERYVAPHYYYMLYYPNGNRYISNGSRNYVMYKYNEIWDYPRIYNSDGNWEYVYDGDHPTVSGDGAFLTSGASDDTISNYGDSVKIIGGAGNDSIRSGSNSLIDAGEGKNTVDSGSYSTIKTGKGNDSIFIDGDSNSIDAGNGNNTVYAYESSNNTIKTGDGNDFVSIYSGSGNSIDAGDGNNIVHAYHYSDKNTIKTGDGDDFVSIYSGYNNSGRSNNFIDVGRGNNTVIIGEEHNTNRNGNNTIKTGSDADFISIGGSSNLIDAGDGDDVIISHDYGYYNSIDAGEGNNTVDSGGYSTIRTGSGNDYISGGGLIDAGDGNNTIIIRYDDKYNFNSNNNTIKTGAGDDFVSIYSSSSSNSIDAGDGNNIVYGDGMIKTGLGNDYIYILFDGYNNSINAGDGNNTIYGGSYSMIKTGDGDDFISIRSGYNNSINAGDGDDVIIFYNYGYYSAIDAGDGDDIIVFSYGGLNLINAGSGKNTIIGYGTSDTLQISGSYIVTRDNDDVLISYGKNSIRLENFAGEEVNINGKMIMVGNGGSGVSESVWELKGTKATYKQNGKTLVTVSGVKSVDGISLSGTTVKLSAASLGTSKVTVSKGYTLELADDVPTVELNEPTWSLKKTTATLNASKTAGYSCDGKTITYTAASNGAALATITGVNSINGIEISGSVITLPTNALGTSAIKLTKGNYTLALADKNLTTATKETSWIISGTKASYKNSTSEHYSIASNGKSISYVKAAPDKNAKDFITLNGINKNLKASDIAIDSKNKTVTLSANALNKKTVTIGGTYGYSLALADDVTKSNVSTPAWSLKKTTATLSQNQSVGYVCDGSTITYSSKAANVNLATITGVNSINGIEISGSVITLPESSLGTSGYKTHEGQLHARPCRQELDDRDENTFLDYQRHKGKLQKFHIGILFNRLERQIYFLRQSRTR